MFEKSSAILPYRTTQGPVARVGARPVMHAWSVFRASFLVFRANRFVGPGSVFLLVGRRQLLLTAANVHLRIKLNVR